MILRRSCRIVAALLVPLSLAGGCAAGAAGVTRGVTIDVLVEGEGRSLARYRVERDGTLRFGGGMDAMNGRFSWSGPMRADEIDRLLSLVDEHRWFEEDPPSVPPPPGEAAGPTYTIRLTGPRGRRTFTVIGESPAVGPARDVLETAARRRHEPFLLTLPRAGERGSTDHGND